MPDIMSVYYNYSQSYNAPLGNLGVGQAIRPETGEMHEMGIKTQVTETMTYTVAGFHIVRNNVPFATIDQTGTPFFSQIGEQRSQGVEMNLVGQLTDRWSWSANYAYVDTLVTDVNNPFLPPGGAPQLNVPLNSGNVWTRYNFIQNNIRTVGAALGVIAAGTRTGNVDGSLLLPAYNRWDMGFYYQQGRFNANCYVENIFDQEYALSSINAFQIMPGAPINARAQIGFVF
jgi:iron complex outermembrane receptor protein